MYKMLPNRAAFDAKMMRGGKQPISRQRRIYCTVQTLLVCTGIVTG